MDFKKYLNYEMINEASLADGVSKELKKLIKNVKSGKGVDPESFKEMSDGELLSAFLTPILQSALTDIKDRKGFKKGFRF